MTLSRNDSEFNSEIILEAMMIVVIINNQCNYSEGGH